MNCKPCMTIRMFFFLLKKHYKQFRKELKEYSLVNYYACEITKYKEPAKAVDTDEALKRLKEVREIAQRKYDPQKEKEFYEQVMK